MTGEPTRKWFLHLIEWDNKAEQGQRGSWTLKLVTDQYNFRLINSKVSHTHRHAHTHTQTLWCWTLKGKKSLKKAQVNFAQIVNLFLSPSLRHTHTHSRLSYRNRKTHYHKSLILVGTAVSFFHLGVPACLCIALFASLSVSQQFLLYPLSHLHPLPLTLHLFFCLSFPLSSLS